MFLHFIPIVRRRGNQLQADIREMYRTTEALNIMKSYSNLGAIWLSDHLVHNLSHYDQLSISLAPLLKVNNNFFYTLLLEWRKGL